MTGKLSSEQSAHNIPLPPPDCNRSRPLIPAGEVSTAIRQLVLRLRRGNPVRKQRVTNSSRFDSDELDGPILVEARSIDNSSPVEESMVSRQHFRDLPEPATAFSASGSGDRQAGKRNKSDPQGSGYAGLPLDRHRVLMNLPAPTAPGSDESPGPRSVVLTGRA